MPYLNQHSAQVDVPPDQAWAALLALGGDERFYAPRDLWRARGVLDRLLGGPGHRITGPGRPLEVGDAMDFWEVVEVHPPTRLRIRALTRLPGTAFLDLEVHAYGAGSGLTVRTTFEPAGLAGRVFWWAELAAHKMVFELMTRRLASLVADGRP